MQCIYLFLMILTINDCSLERNLKTLTLRWIMISFLGSVINFLWAHITYMNFKL